MFQDGGGREGGVVGVVGVGVPIRLVVHLYKEQRIIIDLFMDRQNRWRPIEMRGAGETVHICPDTGDVEGFTKTSGEPAAAPRGLCLPPRYRTENSLKTETL